MTIAQFIVAYSVCWWLVLFMVLPHKADASANPAKGHAPSAPENPRLRPKFLLTSALAIVPTLVIYLLATQAHAEDTIYHVGGSGGCEALESYQAPADISTRDGHGAGDKKVAPANLESSTALGDMDHVDIPIKIPVEKYVDKTKYNVDLSQTNVEPGTLRVGMDGSTELNGRPVKNQAALPAGCTPKTKVPTAADGAEGGAK